MLEVRYNAEKRHFLIAAATLMPAINDWPGWRRAPSGTYYAPAWPSSIIAMTKTVHPLRWDIEAATVRDSLLDQLRLARDALQHGAVLGLRWPTERIPKPHQARAVQALHFMGCRALLADDMGLGKTSTVLWAAHKACVHRLLVICPVSVKFNWKNEIAITLGDKWHSVVIDGGSKKRAQQLAEAQTIRNAKNTAIIINYDLLRHLPEEHWRQLREFAEGNMAILDECHYVKGRDAERTVITGKITFPASYVIGMTGTPIRNLADDLFSQVEIIRPGTWTSYHDFAKRHLVIRAVKLGKREQMKVVGTNNLDALNAVMNTLQIKRKKEEVLDLPPKIHTFPELQLEGEHLKFYKTMKDFARVEIARLIKDGELDGKTLVFDPRARSAVEQAMRCEQIANGFIGGIPDPLMSKIGNVLDLAFKIVGRPNELVFPSSAKPVWLWETVESVLKQGGAPIVFSRFNGPLVWLQLRLIAEGVQVGFLHGGLSATQKQDVIEGFQGHRFDVLLAQVKIAEGWNATRSQDVIFWCRDWSPAVNVQGEDRTHRMGQKGTVNVQVPIVRNTIEMLIHRRLTAKSADAEQALRTVTIEELMEAL